MLTMFLLYRPAFFFSTIATAMFAAAFLLGVRFLYYYFQGAGDGMIQSLILLSILAFASFLFFALAIIGELLKSNRKILEEILYQQRKANVHK